MSAEASIAPSSFFGTVASASAVSTGSESAAGAEASVASCSDASGTSEPLASGLPHAKSPASSTAVGAGIARVSSAS